MNKLPIYNQHAIVLWKSFHAAALHKKRRGYLIGYHWNGEHYENRILKGRKIGLLSIEHYILLNLLRELPPERGYNVDSAAYKAAVGTLLWAARGDTSRMLPYWQVFGSEAPLKRLILEAFDKK